MATEVASIYAKIGADTSGLEKGLGQAKSGMAGLGKTIAGIATAIAGAFVVKAVFNFGKEVVAEAMDAEDKLTELNAVIASTKGVSGMTSDAVLDIADSLSKLTPFEDDAIVAGESMLLTFTNIGKDVFPQATEAMLNMAQKFGGIDAASIQLGKALNDPIGGVTALRRVGVMLTDDQEKQIKSFMAVNDIASAQAVILGELDTEFGGLAKAMGQTTLGKITRFKNAFGNLKETLGTALLPTIGKVAEKFGNFLNDNMPAIAAFAEKVGAWIGGAFEKVWNWTEKAWTKVSGFLGIFKAVFADIASGDIGLAIDDFFEGFYDQLTAMGINVPAAKLFIQNLVDEFAWIPAGIAKIFEDGKGIVSLAFQGLTDGDVWKSALIQLGTDMQALIIQGLSSLAAIGLYLSQQIEMLATNPIVLTGITNFVASLVGGITRGIVNALIGPDNTAKTGQGISDGVNLAVQGITENLFNAGISIAGAIANGIVAGLAGAVVTRDVANAFAKLLGVTGLTEDQWRNLINMPRSPLHPSMPTGNPWSLTPEGVGLPASPTAYGLNSMVTPQGKGSQGGNIMHVWNIKNTDPRKAADEVLIKLRSAGMA